MSRLSSTVWDRLRRGEREGSLTPEGATPAPARAVTPASSSNYTVSSRSYEYNAQPTEDHEGRIAEYYAPGRKFDVRTRRPSKKSANYKPTALTWPFIVAQICLLSIAMALVIYVRDTMPNSDSTAVIESRSLQSAAISPDEGTVLSRRITWIDARQAEGREGEDSGDSGDSNADRPSKDNDTPPSDDKDKGAKGKVGEDDGGEDDMEVHPAHAPLSNFIEPGTSSVPHGRGGADADKKKESQAPDPDSGAKRLPDNFVSPGKVTLTNAPPQETDEGGSDFGKPGFQLHTQPSDNFQSPGTKTIDKPAAPSSTGGGDRDILGEPVGGNHNPGLPESDHIQPGTTTIVNPQVGPGNTKAQLPGHHMSPITTSIRRPVHHQDPGDQSKGAGSDGASDSKPSGESDGDAGTPTVVEELPPSVFGKPTHTTHFHSQTPPTPPNVANGPPDDGKDDRDGKAAPGITEKPGTTIVAGGGGSASTPGPGGNKGESPKPPASGNDAQGQNGGDNPDSTGPSPSQTPGLLGGLIGGLFGGGSEENTKPPPKEGSAKGESSESKDPPKNGNDDKNQGGNNGQPKESQPGIFGGVPPAPTEKAPKLKSNPKASDDTKQEAKEPAPVPITVIKEKSPVTTTIVSTPPPKTVAQAGGGQSVITEPPVTQVKTLPGSTVTKVSLWRPGGKPTTMTMLVAMGGTPTTVVTTPAPVTKFQTKADGKVETMVITQPALTKTTTVGATTKTITTAIKPDVKAIVITTFLVKTIGGTTMSVTKTKPPQTNVKTVDGHPITEVITPAPEVEETVVGGTLSTLWTVITLEPLPVSATETNDIPQPTATDDSSSQNVEYDVFGFTNGDYFVGTFLPTLIAAGLSIPLTIIDLNAKLYQPFQALARSGGAAAIDSLTLKFYAHHAFITPCALLFQGLPVTFVTSLLVWLSWLLTPLVAEAIGMKAHGSCKHDDGAHGCIAQLGVSIVPSHILVAVLGCMVVLLLLLLFLLRDWDTGVAANPWCVAGIASLTTNRATREPLIKHPELMRGREVDRLFYNKGYRLGVFQGRGGQDEYGIVPLESAAGLTLGTEGGDENERHNAYAYGAITTVMGGALGSDTKGKQPGKRHMPFLALSYVGRSIFAVFLVCVLIVIVYYNVLDEDNAFERFMDEWRHFGVRFLFAGIGVAISFFWTCFFLSLAAIAPFTHMSSGPQPPRKSVLLTRPTNPYYGLYTAYHVRSSFMFFAGLMTILAEFLPVLLINIPYHVTHTWISFLVCIRLSMAILAAMILTLLASMVLVRFPHMPVDPRTVAGAAFYSCDSVMGREFKGQQLSMLDGKERTRRVGEMGRRYFYGPLTGVSGVRRAGVDADDEAVEVPAEEGNFI